MIVDTEARLRFWLRDYSATAEQGLAGDIERILALVDAQRREIVDLQADILHLKGIQEKSNGRKANDRCPKKERAR